MHKKRQKNRPLGPMPMAGRLVITGTLFLALGFCDVAVRLYEGLVGGEIGLFLRMSGDLESLAAAATVLIGGGLLLDYCERREP